MSEPDRFLLITCQVGAEHAVKSELARKWPAFRFAYSRPGFLTFKLPPDAKLADDFDLESVFARSYAFSLGKATGSSPRELAEQARSIAGPRPYDRLHVWQRDQAAPGEHAFQPGLTPEATEAATAIRAAGLELRGGVARPGELVLDCVLVQPDEWWLGCHRARRWASRHPGGLSRIEMPPHAVSRAWLKMEEALRWSRLPIEAGQKCAEIGCAPGGSCQALLDRGLLVTGIDPAAVDPAVLAHPNFVHIRKRGSDVRRRVFRGIRWLMADMNVAPGYTLDTVEGIVTHPQVNIRGLLLMLKLMDWHLAEEVPSYLERVRAWGFPYLDARQLQHNRQEICLSARKTRKRQRPAGTG